MIAGLMLEMIAKMMILVENASPRKASVRRRIRKTRRVTSTATSTGAATAAVREECS
jgi:hypothetical protein